jgi:imidazole glycerol-phosphate synthase subunit HisH
MISILDLNLGNIKSLENCLNYMGAKFKKIETKEDINTAKKIIIPGVGSFDFAMSFLKKKNYISNLKKFALIKKKPILGICIGMQILFNESSEGKEPGLCLLDGSIIKLKPSNEFKVPNVGFSEAKNYKDLGVFKNLEENLSFYFTNSYALKFNKKYNFDNQCIIEHSFKFFGAIQKNNIFGLQFHPELSHTSGLFALKNFINLEK